MPLPWLWRSPERPQHNQQHVQHWFWFPLNLTQLNSTQLNSTSIQFNSFRWLILCCSLPFSVGSLQSLPCCPYDFPLSFSDLPNHWFPFPLHCQLIACDLLLPIPFAHFYCLSVCTFITRSFLNFTNTNINWNFLFTHFKRKGEIIFQLEKD